MRLLPGLLTAACLTFAPAIAGTASAHDYRLGELEIGHPWIRATPPGASTAGAYLTVHNQGAAVDRLVGATTSAGKVEIHLMTVEDGIMKMRPVPDGLEIQPGQTLELKPNSYHLMITGLPAAIVQGTRVPMTLSFEKAGEIAVELAVEPVGAPAPDKMQDMHEMH